MSILQVDNLTKDFRNGRGIFDVSFSINEGEVFGFLGPNGAGKTTTIRHLMGFTKPTKGTATILQKDASQLAYQTMKHIGYLPGEIALPEGLTGWQFIRMIQKMRKSTNEAYLQQLLTRFDLDPSGSTKRMSLGNKRKLAIVTAFMDDPKILILDEPTSGLDPVMQEKFIQFMIEEKQRGKTILLSSHVFPEVEATCDRIAIIKEGRIVSEVTASDIKNEAIKTYELKVPSLAVLETIANDFSKSQPIIKRNQLALEIKIASNSLNSFFRALKSYPITHFKEIAFDLENYFLDFYRTEKEFEGMI